MAGEQGDVDLASGRVVGRVGGGVGGRVGGRVGGGVVGRVGGGVGRVGGGVGGVGRVGGGVGGVGGGVGGVGGDRRMIGRRQLRRGVGVVAAVVLAACSGGSADTAGSSATSPDTATSAAATPPATTPGSARSATATSESATSAPATVAPVVSPSEPVAAGPELRSGPFTAIDAAVDPGWGRATLLDAFAGAAGVTTADLNGDGLDEVIVNGFGKISVNEGILGTSSLAVLYQTGGPQEMWRDDLVTPEDEVYFLNEPLVADIDDDDDLDLVAGTGFFVCANFGDVGPCGGLVSWINTGVTNGIVAWERRDILALGADRFYHRPALADLDGDGRHDLVAGGELFDGAETVWFAGTLDGGFDPTPRLVGPGGGSFVTVTDVDGDDDADVVSGQYFHVPESAVWFEQTTPGTFTRHVITDEVGKVIQLSLVPDLDGTGTPGWVMSNHTNTAGAAPAVTSGIYRLRPGPDPRQPWAVELISEGIESRKSVGIAFQAAPGVFGAGDLDGDGDVDLAVSGDGDDRLFVLEQTALGRWTTRVIEEGFGQAGGMHLADLDGDARHEILAAGFEAAEIRAYVPAAR